MDQLVLLALMALLAQLVSTDRLVLLVSMEVLELLVSMDQLVQQV
jgi:hypothetical protein